MPPSISPMLASLSKAFTMPAARQSLRPARAAAAAAAAPLSTLTRIPTITSTLPSPSSRSQSQSQTQFTRPFSTTTALPARKKDRTGPWDRRITLIRYFLYHPRTPRPLRFSRNRYLRHWTIHRAWHLYQSQLRAARTLDLARLWHSTNKACEELRVAVVARLPSPTNAGPNEKTDSAAAGTGTESTGAAKAGEKDGEVWEDDGFLFKRAMSKKGLYARALPIEYGRLQTETPSKTGWNYEWVRKEEKGRRA